MALGTKYRSSVRYYWCCMLEFTQEWPFSIALSRERIQIGPFPVTMHRKLKQRSSHFDIYMVRDKIGLQHLFWQVTNLKFILKKYKKERGKEEKKEKDEDKEKKERTKMYYIIYRKSFSLSHKHIVKLHQTE